MIKKPLILVAFALTLTLACTLIQPGFASEGDSIQIDNVFLVVLNSVYFWVTLAIVSVALYNSKRHWDYKMSKK